METRSNPNILTSEVQLERLCAREKWVNPYEVLLIGPDASEDAIKSKFRKLSLLLHPDRCRDERALQAFQSNPLFSSGVCLSNFARPRKEKHISTNHARSP